MYLDASIGYLGIVPQDERLRDAVRAQMPVTEKFPNSAASIAFQRLAKTVNELPFHPPTNGYLEFYVERVAGQNNTIAGTV